LIAAAARLSGDEEVMTPDNFAARLGLALKAASISRGQLAAELGVDKSVVSRWIGGVNTPSSHNLSRLTLAIAARCGGFNMLDWERPGPEFEARIGAASLPPRGSHQFDSPPSEFRLTDYIPPTVLQEAVATTKLRGSAYEGFWRSTRPANEPLGGFIRDQIMIWQSQRGLLRFRLGVYDMRFEGWTLPIQTQLFCVASDPVTGVFLFAIFNAVLRNRAEVMDGLTLTLQREAGGAPVAAACLLERVGNLSGDDARDEARFRDLANQDPVAPAGSVPKYIRDHLWHDVGPSAFAAGGAPLLAMAFTASLSRGPVGAPLGLDDNEGRAA
jgi:transcriptional regulator with XRE-family HTH domain